MKAGSLLCLLAVISGCAEGDMDLGAEIGSLDKYNIPDQFVVTLKNRGPKAISIYRPSTTQYFFWQFEVEYLDGSIKSFVERGDVAWFESDPLLIESNGS